jgi:hypothetical protein
MPGAPQKPKWAAATITKLAQKLAKIANNQIENKTLPPFPRIPTMANGVLWIAVTGIWKE